MTILFIQLLCLLSFALKVMRKQNWFIVCHLAHKVLRRRLKNVTNLVYFWVNFLFEFWNFCVEDDDEPEDGRDVSLLRADQALIVSGCDHSFPSAPGPHTWPHGHGPGNHPRAQSWPPLHRKSTRTRHNRKWVPVARGALGSQGRCQSEEGDEEQGQVSGPVTRCQQRLSRWCHDYVTLTGRWTQNDKKQSFLTIRSKIQHSGHFDEWNIDIV